MTPSEKKLAADALRGGLKRLWNGRGVCPWSKHSCICNTLADGPGRPYVTALISERLGGYLFASSWLNNEVPSAMGASDRRVQEWRRLWMLALIKELES